MKIKRNLTIFILVTNNSWSNGPDIIKYTLAFGVNTTSYKGNIKYMDKVLVIIEPLQTQFRVHSTLKFYIIIFK